MTDIFCHLSQIYDGYFGQALDAASALLHVEEKEAARLEADLAATKSKAKGLSALSVRNLGRDLGRFDGDLTEICDIFAIFDGYFAIFRHI